MELIRVALTVYDMLLGGHNLILTIILARPLHSNLLSLLAVMGITKCIKGNSPIEKPVIEFPISLGQMATNCRITVICYKSSTFRKTVKSNHYTSNICFINSTKQKQIISKHKVQKFQFFTTWVKAKLCAC